MCSRAILALAAASLVGHTVARNPRHQVHRHLHKKDVDVVVNTVIEWVTITVEEGSVPSTSTANSTDVMNANANVSQQGLHDTRFGDAYLSSAAVVAAAAPSSTSTTSITTTTSVDINVNANVNANVDAFGGASIGVGVSIGGGRPGTAATTSAAAAATPGASPGNGGTGSTGGTGGASGTCERGLAFNNFNLLAPFLQPGTLIDWYYDWGQTPGGSTYEGTIPFCAMLWGPSHVPGWSSNAQDAISKAHTAGKTPCLLSSNEPDNGGQSNLSPADAAALHIQEMNPFSGQATISSPAITNSNNPNEGTDWLRQWISACAGQCAYNVVACHAYNVDGQGVLDYLLRVYAVAGTPVWLTEIQFSSNAVSELKYLLDQIEHNPTYSFVQKIAYFWVDDGGMQSGNTLTELGSLFAYGT